MSLAPAIGAIGLPDTNPRIQILVIVASVVERQPPLTRTRRLDILGVYGEGQVTLGLNVVAGEARDK
jgi:hypothetical protein